MGQSYRHQTKKLLEMVLEKYSKRNIGFDLFNIYHIRFNILLNKVLLIVLLGIGLIKVCKEYFH